MKDEVAIEVLRKHIKCITQPRDMCPGDCLSCELLSSRDKDGPAFMTAVSALRDRIRMDMEIVRCRDCALDGTITCTLARIERGQMIFINHDPDWFCADGVRKEVHCHE